MDIRTNGGSNERAPQWRRNRVRSGQDAISAKTISAIVSAATSDALPFGAHGLVTEHIGTKLVPGNDAADGVFDCAASIRGNLPPAAPAGNGGRPDAQGIGKPILSSKEVDGFFERGDGHGREFSHELMPDVKPSANYMSLATS
jgi:hypothetical protein